MAEHRMANVTHEAIRQWDWPEMTMDLTIDESVDFAALEQGMTLQVEISKTQDDQYLISNVRIPGTNDQKFNLDDISLDDMNFDDMDSGDDKK